MAVGDEVKDYKVGDKVAVSVYGGWWLVSLPDVSSSCWGEGDE